MAEQVYPADLEDKMVRLIANNLAFSANNSITSPEDDCQEWKEWGVSCYSTKNGELTIEYSIDTITWRVLDQIVVISTKPVEILYPVKWRWYRVTYTDESGEASALDLTTTKKNG